MGILGERPYRRASAIVASAALAVAMAKYCGVDPDCNPDENPSGELDDQRKKSGEGAKAAGEPKPGKDNPPGWGAMKDCSVQLTLDEHGHVVEGSILSDIRDCVENQGATCTHIQGSPVWGIPPLWRCYPTKKGGVPIEMEIPSRKKAPPGDIEVILRVRRDQRNRLVPQIDPIEYTYPIDPQKPTWSAEQAVSMCHLATRTWLFPDTPINAEEFCDDMPPKEDCDARLSEAIAEGSDGEGYQTAMDDLDAMLEENEFTDIDASDALRRKITIKNEAGKTIGTILVVAKRSETKGGERDGEINFTYRVYRSEEDEKGRPAHDTEAVLKHIERYERDFIQDQPSL